MPFIGSIEGQYGYGRGSQGQIVTSGLQVNLDAGNTASYSGSGTTWTDLTGNGRNATLVNTPTYSSANSGYLSFVAASLQYATVANIGSINRWTVEAWFRPSASLSGIVTSVVSNEFNGSILNFSLGTNRAPTSYNLCAGFYDGAWRTTNGYAPTLNQWVQVVGVYDGTTVTQYTNGAVLNSLTYSGTPTSGGGIRIARRWDDTLTSTNFYSGDISVIRIYNIALSAPQVLQNFNAVRGRYSL
jgi:hypothetical protein